MRVVNYYADNANNKNNTMINFVCCVVLSKHISINVSRPLLHRLSSESLCIKAGKRFNTLCLTYVLMANSVLLWMINKFQLFMKKIIHANTYPRLQNESADWL